MTLVVPQVLIVTGASQASCRPFTFVTRRIGIAAPAPFIIFDVIRMVKRCMYAMYRCMHLCIYVHTRIFMYGVDLCEKRGAWRGLGTPTCVPQLGTYMCTTARHTYMCTTPTCLPHLHVYHRYMCGTRYATDMQCNRHAMQQTCNATDMQRNRHATETARDMQQTPHTSE